MMKKNKSLKKNKSYDGIIPVVVCFLISLCLVYYLLMLRNG